MASSHPVPAHAARLRDFVNTYDVEEGVDELATPEDLGTWLAGRQLIPRETSVATGDLRAAIALRESLRTAMLANHGPGEAVPAELDDILAGLPLRVSLTGQPHLVPVAQGANAGLALIAAAIIESTGDGTWPRLKVCQESTCQWAFLDTSKNRSRTWCSMRVCGNRQKTRAYRARQQQRI